MNELDMLKDYCEERMEWLDALSRYSNDEYFLGQFIELASIRDKIEELQGEDD